MIYVQALLEKFPLGLELPLPETPHKQQPAQLLAEVCVLFFTYAHL